MTDMKKATRKELIAALVESNKALHRERKALARERVARAKIAWAEKEARDRWITVRGLLQRLLTDLDKAVSAPMRAAVKEVSEWTQS